MRSPKEEGEVGEVVLDGIRSKRCAALDQISDGRHLLVAW
jgi:hypothetical protein